jgi:hypothetical protein
MAQRSAVFSKIHGMLLLQCRHRHSAWEEQRRVGGLGWAAFGLAAGVSFSHFKIAG